MFLIGDVEITNQVIAAPMAGVSDRAFRMIAKSFGCGLVFTEMISDMGLVFGQARTLHIADTTAEKRPIAFQIFGSKPESMAQAAVCLEKMGADIIDINMGCPTPKIIKNGEGAALMLDIPRCRQIIRRVAEAVRIPVTVKMRTGWDDGHTACLELALVAQEEGAQAITLHPRSRMQFFSGHSDWDMIREVKKILKIPLIGNGDINSGADALRMIRETSCDAVMIGRGALGNPFLFREAAEILATGTVLPPPTFAERIETAREHLELAIKFKGEGVAVREMRKHISWYLKGIPGAAKIRVQINQASTRAEMLAIMRT
ncbi:MAG: tRNA dihydrouridine synthase DusB [Syntrophomonas sp.]|nr:tRNA dihydrouridine synthase DusB [Syntrophomonas sp.]